MGVLAVYGYGLVAATGENSRALNQVIQDVMFISSNLSLCNRFSSTKKCFHTSLLIVYKSTINTRRSFYPTRTKHGRHIPAHPLPFLLIFFRDETVKINYQWDMNRFLTYISTWSGYVHYMEKHPERDVLFDLRRE